jgi:prepilin-type N-terminal cleavage/methylation domain-containing protein
MKHHIMHRKTGFSLVELLVALAIMAVLSGGIATTIYQIFMINNQSNDSMLVIRQVQTLGQWLNRDIQMAQITDTTTGSLLVLTWDYRPFSDDNYAGEKHVITYSYDPDTGIIERQDETYQATEPAEGNPDNVVSTQTILIAQYITNTTFSEGELAVTAERGTQSETRIYEITNRVTQQTGS